MRSRGKEDIWHMFNALPLAKKSVIKGPVMRLLIVSTFCFIDEDYQETKAVVMKKSAMQEDRILDHFLHNLEYWKKSAFECQSFLRINI